MNRPKLSINIGKLKLKNPVMVASGTFSYAEEFKDFIDLGKLGAIITKTITLEPEEGSLPPRTCETACGLLNSIGLQNEGVDNFISEKLPRLEKLNTNIIASIAADTPEGLMKIIRRLNDTDINAIELNLSCPNIKRKKNIRLLPKTLVSQHAPWTKIFVSAARKAAKKTLITKLSPNVTNITEIAKAAASAGSDALSLVNTFYGMAIDIDTRMPRLGNSMGGLSGPAIKPIALKMVYDAARNTNLPIIGMGGIMDATDALEFIIAGASCVCVGTANFINPRASIEIISGIEKYLEKNNISSISKLVGSIKCKI